MRERKMSVLVGQLRRWCNDPSNDPAQPDGSLALLRDGIGKRAPFRIMAALEDLVPWYGSTGAREILDGNPDGWRAIQQCLMCRYWALRIGAHRYDRDARPDRPNVDLVSNAALALVHAVALGNNDVSAWIGDRMVRSLDDGAFGSWQHTPFEPFALKLWGMAVGREISYAGRGIRSLGVYQGVLDAWNDAAGLERALYAACDYHLKNATPGAGFPEFQWPPYDLFPAEVLAIVEVRKRMRMDTPEIDHPLMRSPLASPPPLPVMFPRDALLEEAFEVARQVLVEL